MYGEKRKVVYFNLDDRHQRRLWEFARNIEFGKEVRQFLGMRMKGIRLEELIAATAQRDTLMIDTTQWDGK